MPNAFDILGVSTDADDETIRKRSLQLIREFPPERDAEKFAKHREAYEKIKTLNDRAEYRLFDIFRDETLEAIIEDAACLTTRPRINLQQLISSTLKVEAK